MYRSISHYRIIKTLGKGGMGEVFLAEDTNLHRKVALKLLSADLTRNEDRLHRFRQEAQAASALSHPNVAHIYEIGDADGGLYIAMEYVEGQRLDQMIGGRPPAVGVILDIAIQIADALDEAHEQGITHRDIKSSNIMITPRGCVKVLDFGLAKLTHPIDSDETDSDSEIATRVKTSIGIVLGTVNYMSPEQALGREVDHRTDIFSLGVVMYEMATGRLPFSGETMTETIDRIAHAQPEAIARLNYDVPPELEVIVKKALRKDRNERYQAVHALLVDLRNLRSELDLSERLEYSQVGVHGSAYLHDAHISDPHLSLPPPVSGSVALQRASSVEYIGREIKKHRRGVALVIAAIVITAAAVIYISARRRPIDSIAVLPLVNAGDDQAMTLVGDAMTQQTIYGLSQLPGLRVKAFNSVRRYSGHVADPQQAARELGVRALLVGSVTRREPDRLVLSLELIDAGDNSIIWGDQYEARFADSRRVQEQILTAVSSKLKLPFSEEEQKRRDVERLYQEGRSFLEKRTADAMLQAIESFKQAIAKDPNCARAHAGISDCYNMLAVYGAMSPKEALPLGKAAAQQALRIDPALAEARAALAFLLYRREWKWNESEEQFKEAIRLSPSYAHVHQWYANLLAARGRHSEAEEEMRRSAVLEPTSLIISAQVGYIYYFAERYDDVIAASTRTLDLDPSFFAAHRYMGLAYEGKGMYEEAIGHFRLAVARSDNSPLVKAELAHALAVSGKKDQAQRMLNDLLDFSKQRYISPYDIALIYAGLNQKGLALKWLEAAQREGADFLVYLKVDPRLKSLHSETRFEAIASRIGLQ